jgi:serine/threonine-protein kinase
MSPEQASGKPVTGAADQFGVAAVLYELAQLERLYGPTDPKKIRELMSRDEGARRAAQLSGRNRDLGPVLMRALQRDAAARYPTAIGMARALSKLVGDPVLMREKLVEIHGTYARLDKVRGNKPDPVRSASTFSRSESRSEPQPYKGGIPVSVGNVHRPLGPGEIDPGARPSAKRGDNLRSTLNLAVLGVALCVLAFVGLRMVPRGDDLAPQAVQEIPAQTIRARPEVEPVPETPKSETPDTRTPAVEARPVPVPEKPARKPRPPVATPAPTPSPLRTPSPVEAAAPELDSGRVTISSLPRSLVTIDGTVLRYTPLLSYTLPAGRHMVVLETDDHRRIQFRLDVAAGDDLRRVWDFDQSLWRDP